MARLKIEDIPVEKSISEEDLKKVYGGLATNVSLASGILNTGRLTYLEPSQSYLTSKLADRLRSSQEPPWLQKGTFGFADTRW
jgi:hypothetical protein